MNKFWLVLKHSYITNAKSKSFLTTTILMVVLVGVLFNLPNIFSYFDKDEVTRVGIIDSTTAVFEPLNNYMKNVNYDDLELVLLESEEQAQEELNEAKINNYFLIDYANDSTLSVVYKAPEVNDMGVVRKIEQGLNQVQFEIRASTVGLTVEQAGMLFQPVQIEKIPLNPEAKSEEEVIQSIALVYILLFAIYFGVLMYGNLVATEIAKEKSSRVMEILVSSVNPIAQMFGKILGMALLGLTQAAVFGLTAYLSLKMGDKKINFDGLSVDFSEIPTSTVVYAIVFFFLGYLLYATIAAMLGSLVSRIEDLQQAIGPLNLIIVAAFMIAMFGLNSPDNSLVVVSSFIPLFTPMIMFLRVGVGNPATWEVVLSIGLLIVSIILLGILAAKVYRGGVLMYGKGATFKNIKKALTINDNR